jgi:hypothetical protein
LIINQCSWCISSRVDANYKHSDQILIIHKMNRRIFNHSAYKNREAFASVIL